MQLPKLGSFTMDPSNAVKRNIENMVGAVQVPVGVAGPLKVKGEYADGSFYVPLATTEGALVASVNRGCGAITRAGGADVAYPRNGMTRAPVFSTRDILHSRAVKDFVDGNRDALAAAAAETTSHGELTGAMAFVTGTTVHVRLEFDTKDAMGMNMVTIASETGCGPHRGEDRCAPPGALGEPLHRQEARGRERHPRAGEKRGGGGGDP